MPDDWAMGPLLSSPLALSNFDRICLIYNSQLSYTSLTPLDLPLFFSPIVAVRLNPDDHPFELIHLNDGLLFDTLCYVKCSTSGGWCMTQIFPL